MERFTSPAKHQVHHHKNSHLAQASHYNVSQEVKLIMYGCCYVYLHNLNLFGNEMFLSVHLGYQTV